ncbi:MAG: choice-of-anchor D domain-containing protein [Candidatus Latescibacterota bacterium]
MVWLWSAGRLLAQDGGLTGVITTVAGDGSTTYWGDGIQATRAALWGPQGVAVDGQGNLYIADTQHDRVRRVDRATGVITTVAGEGTWGYAGDGGPATTAHLARPTGVELDAQGNLYIADYVNNRVRRIDALTGVISTVAGNGRRYPATVPVNAQPEFGDGGPATSAAVDSPVDVALDAQGNLYIASAGNSCVRRVDVVTEVITTVAGTGIQGLSGDGGPATSANLWYPRSIAVDGQGNLYIADHWNHRVRRVDAVTQVITTVAGSGVTGPITVDAGSPAPESGDDGLATEASVLYPQGVAVDDQGNLYVSEGLWYPGITQARTPRVRRVDAVTGVITTVAGNGVPGYSGDHGPATRASLDGPQGVAVDRRGNLYIADALNNRVRRVWLPNQPPALAAIDTQRVAEGELLSLTLSATDPDGEVVSYAVAGNPAGSSLSGTSFAWTPAYAQADTYAVIFSVADDKGGTDSMVVTIVVADTNRPPVLAAIAPQSLVTGASLRLRLVATDADGDTLSYAVTDGPAGSRLTGASFAWTPDDTQAGTYSVTFTVDDGRGGTATQVVPITVTQERRPLALAPPGAQTVRELDVLRLPLTASRPPGESVTFSVTGAPGGVAVVDSVLWWRPALYQRGTYRFAVTATDTRGQMDSVTVAVTVVGRARHVTTSADTLQFGAVAVGRPTSLTLTVGNAGSETLSITGLVPGDPQYEVSSESFSLAGGGSRDVTVTLTPMAGRSAAATLTVLSNDPERPRVTVVLAAAPAALGGPAALSVLPASLTFGSVILAQSRTVTLQVTNTGGSNLRVLNVVSSSTDVTLSSDGFMLAPGEEEMLAVTLRPLQLGDFSETLELQSNDPLQPVVQVPLRATVTSSSGRPSLTLDAPSVSFGQVATGETSEFLLPVRNAGTAPLLVSNVVSDNVQVVVSPTSLSIAPEDTRVLTVRYRPMPGMSLSGRLTLYTNDATQPQVGVAWSAVELRSPYLQLTRVTPADGSSGVATTTEITLVFGEPLYHRRGFTALDVALIPEPLSGPVGQGTEVRGDGRTVVIPVVLARDTVYRLVVYGATGRSGLELFDMAETSFSTGAAPPVLAKVSGRVSEASGLQVQGSVYLVDPSHRLAGQASVALDGSFELAGVPEGSYRLYLDGTVPDGQGVGGSHDADGDGVADAFSVRAGVDQTGLQVAATVRGGPAPAVSSGAVEADLDSAAGDQRLTVLHGVAGGQSVVLEVHAAAAEGWTGAAVTVAYDSAQVSFAGASEGDNLLRSNGGTALFLSHVDPAAATVEFGGAILGATASTAVSGTGLLGRLRFTTLDGFTGQTALRVILVKVQSLTGRTNVEPNVTAMLLSSQDGGTASASGAPLALDFDSADGDQGQSVAEGAAPGRTYVVQLHARDAPAINGWSARIEYDPQQVRYLSGSFQVSGMIPGLVSLVEEKGAYVSVGGAVLGGAAEASGNGLLGSASFEVLPGFADSTQLVVGQMSWKRVGSGEEMLTVDVRGTIRARPAVLPADFTGDGVVNFGDFFAFADAFGGTDPAYDLTGDGQVNFGDFFVFADAFGSEARAKLLQLAREHLGLPGRAALSANYPNPFNAQTTVEYRLHQPGWVRLCVYDLAGQRVRTLVDGGGSPGRHRTVWNGRDDAGRPLATGVYFCHLVTQGGTQVRRLLLLR